ncbi:MAG: CRISPR-associated helicase Cas3' [Bacteroidetes bacterium]|nr:CRISPR-associated helicase Cas3' [Bacteroidota bacterium]
MTKYYAHSLENKLEKEWQELDIHLTEVADLAVKIAKTACPHDKSFGKLARLAGLLHDLGKYRTEFQEYLRKKRQSGVETAHAVYGAGKALFDHESLAAAFAIAGHHAGLYDASDLDLLVNGKKFKVHDRIKEILNHTAEKIKAIEFKESYLNNDTPEERLRYEILIRMLFSLLVDADRLNTEEWEKRQLFDSQWKRKSVSINPIALLQKLQDKRTGKSNSSKNVNLKRLRNDIFEVCLNKGQNSPQGFFSLTVPTGGGKTLSSMAFALTHAQRHNLRRVIVVIPYLSIIEQNAKEYREIFSKENVLEHHSSVDVSRSDEDPAQAQDIEKAMENWDVPIVVTTSVQFIETLFSATPAQARKLHNITQSVVIFDEVQTLPTHLLEPLLDVLRELKNRYGVSFVFCSATQPAFKKTTNLKNGFGDDEITEIAPNPDILYQSLQRVKYTVERFDLPWTWQDVAQKMIEHDQVLCILNLRRQAYELLVAIRRNLEERNIKDLDESVFHLSSAMCPAHRLDRIEIIKRRLKTGKPCWVVSTQLIEAGVDIDFPVVFRAMGPLDSIVQSAGRCNRENLLVDENGKPRLGEVIVFSLQDGGLPQGIYNTATNIAVAHLDMTRLATDPELFKEYFTELYQVTPTDYQRRGMRTIQQERTEFNFRKVDAMAGVIKDDTIAVIVPYGNATDIIAKIRENQSFDREDIRSLQRYMVNLRKGFHSDYEKLKSALTPLIPERLEIPVLNKLFYDIKTHRGVIVENLPPEELMI